MNGQQLTPQQQMAAAQQAAYLEQKKSLQQSSVVKCSQCGNTTFNNVIMLRKTSKLITGRPNDDFFPIPLLECTHCHTITTEGLSDDIRELVKDDIEDPKEK